MLNKARQQIEVEALDFSGWSSLCFPTVDIHDFQKPLKKLKKGEHHYSVDRGEDVSRRCQIIAEIPVDCRENFGRAVEPVHESEKQDTGLLHTQPVSGVVVKKPGETAVKIETRLEQFIPFVAMSSLFYKRNNPTIFCQSTAILSVKQWKIHPLSTTTEGPLHADPPANQRDEYKAQDSFLISDCMATIFVGCDLKPYQIVAFDSQANHRQPAFSGKDLINGCRTMAHLSFVR